MVERRGLARLKGWPLVVILGCGLVSCVGFIYAAARMRSMRWAIVAVVTWSLSLVGWILISAWQHDGQASAAASAYVVEMWIAFVVLAWVMSKDYVVPTAQVTRPAALDIMPGSTTPPVQLSYIAPASKLGAIAAPPPPPSVFRQHEPVMTPPISRPTARPDQAPVAMSGSSTASRGDFPVRAGGAISTYTSTELGKILDWIAADGVTRTKDEFLTKFLDTMGYKRRGSRIVSAFDAAYANFQRRHR